MKKILLQILALGFFSASAFADSDIELTPVFAKKVVNVYTGALPVFKKNVIVGYATDGFIRVVFDTSAESYCINRHDPALNVLLSARGEDQIQFAYQPMLVPVGNANGSVRAECKVIRSVTLYRH